MKKAIRRYSEGFRRSVVAEYEAGSKISTLQKKYGIKGMNTIQHWVRKYGNQGLRYELIRIQTAEEADRTRELEKRVKELEQALGKVTLEKLKLESTLEVIEETYGDVTKKNEAKLSSAAMRKCNKEKAVE